MSYILDARKNFLNVLRSSEMDPDLKVALIEWSDGKDELLARKYPGLSQCLAQSFEFHYATFDLIKCKSTDAIERSAEAIEYESEPLIISEKQIKYADRPLDIVLDFDELIRLEKSAKRCKLIDSHRKIIHNKRKCNKQCIIGFVVVLFRNKIFKNVCANKPGPDKSVSFHDVLVYCQERYDFGSLETGKRNLENCAQKALDRIPDLREFEEQNNQKNQLTFNKQKS